MASPAHSQAIHVRVHQSEGGGPRRKIAESPSFWARVGADGTRRLELAQIGTGGVASKVLVAMPTGNRDCRSYQQRKRSLRFPEIFIGA